MEKEAIIKVLWIDDQPTGEFMDSAYDDFNIEIISKTNVQDGIDYLESNMSSLDAIILDANCITSNSGDETPNLVALTNAINEISKFNTFIPWFVYTGGGYEGKSVLNYIIPDNRPWDLNERKFYDKPADYERLLENILLAVKNRESTRIKLKYEKPFLIYKDNANLLDILQKFESDEGFDKDEKVPNSIRDIVEWIMRFCDLKGFLAKPFTGTNIAECSKLLGDKKLQMYIPSYIQRSLHFISEYSNAGSHRYTNQHQHEEIIGESIKKNIRECKAVYLNKMAVYSLLSILEWCYNIEKDEELTKALQIQVAYDGNK